MHKVYLMVMIYQSWTWVHFWAQSNPIHGWIQSMSNSVTYTDDSMESYSQRAVTGASKSTPGDAKCVTKIRGGTEIRGGAKFTW